MLTPLCITKRQTSREEGTPPTCLPGEAKWSKVKYIVSNIGGGDGAGHSQSLAAQAVSHRYDVEEGIKSGNNYTFTEGAFAGDAKTDQKTP